MATDQRRAEAQGWIEALLKELRQVINSPTLAARVLEGDPHAGLSTRDCTGINFLATANFTIGIEAVGRLATGKSNAADAAATFMSEFFPPDYGGHAELIWRLFRHGHIHNYIPQRVEVGGVEVYGKVAWVDSVPLAPEGALLGNRSGLLNALDPAHLDFSFTIPNIYAYTIYPQIAVLDLAEAVGRWRLKLDDGDEIARMNFDRGLAIVDREQRTRAAVDSPIGRLLRSRGLVNPNGGLGG